MKKLLVVTLSAIALLLPSAASAEDVSCKKFEELATSMLRYNAKQAGAKVVVSPNLSEMARGYASRFYTMRDQQVAFVGSQAYGIKYLKVDNASATFPRPWWEFGQINHASDLASQTSDVANGIMPMLPITYIPKGVVGIGFQQKSKGDSCIGAVLFKEPQK